VPQPTPPKPPKVYGNIDNCNAEAMAAADEVSTIDAAAIALLGAVIGYLTGDPLKAVGKGAATGVAGTLVWKSMKYNGAMQACQTQAGYNIPLVPY